MMSPSKKVAFHPLPTRRTRIGKIDIAGTGSIFLPCAKGLIDSVTGFLAAKPGFAECSGWSEHHLGMTLRIDD